VKGKTNASAESVSFYQETAVSSEFPFPSVPPSKPHVLPYMDTPSCKGGLADVIFNWECNSQILIQKVEYKYIIVSSKFYKFCV
jgi:hypothetical protein